MKTNPASKALRAPTRSIKVALAVAALAVLTNEAEATEAPPAVPVVPGHVYVARGASFRNGDWVALEPAGVFLFGPPGADRSVVLVARAVLGLGGSGGGIGVAASLTAPCPGAPPCDATEFFSSGVAILEARVERMYGPTTWRDRTYAGPQLTLSGSVIKASVGWMVDANDRSDQHLQIGFGSGF